MPPRNPRPIRPRAKDARDYNQRIAAAVLEPLYQQLRSNLNRAANLAAALNALDRVLGGLTLEQRAEVERIAAQQGQRLNLWHRERFLSSLQAAIGIDVAPTLSALAEEGIVTRWVARNVDLIVTIPERFHDGLKTKMERNLIDHPFDQDRTMRMLRTEYRSQGYNVRRLTRDQTNKMIGQLTEERQTRIGVQQYRWLTARDPRVRETHRKLDGTIQRWDTPPDEGHPGYAIQCRCVAVAILDQVPERRRPVAEARVVLPQPPLPRLRWT